MKKFYERFVVSLLIFALIWAHAALATAPTPSVNPNIPAQNSALTSVPLRGNFLAIYNDETTLFGLTQPFGVSNAGIVPMTNGAGSTYYLTAAGLWAPIPTTGVTSIGLTMDGVIFNSSVAGSPITTSGIFAPTLATQSANCVLAGPVSGSAATPTCRALIGADIPAPTTSAKGGILALASATAHNVLQYIDTSGIQHLVQLAFSDLSGSLATTQMPAGTGDVSWSAGTTSTTLATVNANPGTAGSASTVAQMTTNGKGLVTAVSSVTITPAAIGSPTDSGTGATGTWPISITGNAATVSTNANLTGVVTSSGNTTSFGTFSSATLAAALTDETGTGAAMFAASPTTSGTFNGAAAIWSGVNTALSFAATGTGANTLPVGSTGQQPGSPAVGMVRYNNTWGGVETYVSSAWRAIWAPPGTYYCALNGALGVSSDDGAAINTCFNSARTYGTNGGTAVLDSIHYAILTALIVDPSKTTVNLGYSQTDCSGLSSGACFTIAQNAGNTSNQGAGFQHELFGGNILLPSSGGTTVDGFLYAGTSVALPTAIYNIHNILVNQGRHADNYNSNTYLVTHRDFYYVDQQSAAVYLPSGFTNNDEAINYFGGVIAQAGSYAMDTEATSGTNVMFNGTSFDFNAFLFNIASGYVNCIACHAEMQGPTLTGPIVNIANATGATLEWVGGQLFMDGSLPGGGWTGTASLVSVGAAGSATFDHVFMNNIALSSGWFASGIGKVRLENLPSFTVPNGFSTITDTGNTYTNILSDPTFAQASIKDPIFITGDTQTVTDVHTGANITLANSTSCSGGGPLGTDAQGLLITKTFGSGSVADAEIIVPIDRMSMPLSSGYYEKTGAQTGTVSIQTNWVEVDGYVNGVPHIINALQNALTTVTLTSSPTAWTAFGGPGMFEGYAPAWATHLQINLNFNSMNAGTFCIGHVAMNEVK